MIVIAAMGRNRVIGNGDRMPWNVPEEFQQFLRIVEGETVIMGRRSWEIFGRHLASAHNIVVSRTLRELAGATVVDSVEKAVETARGFGRTVYSAGGAQLYAATVPLAERMYLSFIEGDFTGDTWFPEFDPSDWRVTQRKRSKGFEFVVYLRR